MNQRDAKSCFQRPLSIFFLFLKAFLYSSTVSVFDGNYIFKFRLHIPATILEKYNNKIKQNTKIVICYATVTKPLKHHLSVWDLYSIFAFISILQACWEMNEMKGKWLKHNVLWKRLFKRLKTKLAFVRSITSLCVLLRLPPHPQHLSTQALLLFSSPPSKLLHEKFKYAWGTSSSQAASQKVGTLNTISCLFNYRRCSKPKPPSIPLPWSAWFIMNALKQNTCSSPRWQIACLQVVCVQWVDFLKFSCDSEPNSGLCWHLEDCRRSRFALNRLLAS